MVMCMCCYEDFYKRAHDQFASVVAQLPTDHRNEALNTIADSFAQGKLAPVDRRGAGEKMFDKMEKQMAKTGSEIEKSQKEAKTKRDYKKKIMLNNQKIRSEMKGESGQAGNISLRPNVPPPGSVDRGVTGKYSSEGAAREWSTVVDISIPPPSFKPDLLSLARFPLF